MDKQKAEQWITELTALLTGKDLVTVSAGPGDRVDVRREQFEKAYCVAHENGNCVVALVDTYGVMTGAEHWHLDPDRRSVHAQTKNGNGEPLHFVWTILDNGEGDAYRAMLDAQKRLWR